MFCVLSALSSFPLPLVVAVDHTAIHNCYFAFLIADAALVWYF
jgi:hypothetical protein